MANFRNTMATIVCHDPVNMSIDTEKNSIQNMRGF